MFKFLHLADIHLDTTFLCRSDTLRARLRDALRTAFERAIDCAVEERVDAVLIAGDLFDNDRLSFSTERFLLEQLYRLHHAGVACFYVTGNHDPGGRRYRSGKLEWPDSFHLISERKPTSFTIEDESGQPLVRIVGMGHVTDREDENLAALFPASTDGIPHVGLLHTFVTTADLVDEHDRYAPCTLEDLRHPRYRYWALGHIHKRQNVCEITEAWYPGNIQGRHARETGPKGGLLVTLDGSGPVRVEFRSFAPVRWAEIILDDLENAHTANDLVHLADDAYRRLASDGSAADDWMLRFTLAGRSPLARDLRDKEQRIGLEELLAARLGALDVVVRADRISPPLDIDRHRGEPHVLAAALDLLDQAALDPDLLMRLAPDALAKDCRTEEEQLAYLRELLQDLDVEAAERLLVEKK